MRMDLVRLWVNVANEMTNQGPAGPPLLKHLNERSVLETIREGAPISRAEISRRAGISKPTVSLALQSLLESGLVREAERSGVSLDRVPHALAAGIHPALGAALAQLGTWDDSVESRATPGGASRGSVTEQLTALRAVFAEGGGGGT